MAKTTRENGPGLHERRLGERRHPEGHGDRRRHNGHAVEHEEIRVEEPAHWASPSPAERTPRWRVSWGAIFGGVVVGMVVMLALMLLGIGIGAAVFDPGAADPATGMGIGAAVWWIVSSLISLFCAGWVASRLANARRRLDGALHGVVAFGLMTLLTVALIGTLLGQIIGGAFGILTANIETVAEVAAPQLAGDDAGPMSVEEIQAEAVELVSGEPQQVQQQISQAVGETFADDVPNVVERQALVGTLVTEGGVEVSEAQESVSRWTQGFAEAEGQAMQEGEGEAAISPQVGEDITEGVTAASIWMFVALVLGGLAAALGGLVGATRRREPATAP